MNNTCCLVHVLHAFTLAAIPIPPIKISILPLVESLQSTSSRTVDGPFAPFVQGLLDRVRVLSAHQKKKGNVAG